ncbi:MAG: SdiA-regulated domain-containing protein [Egibacteraceae bacterium]
MRSWPALRIVDRWDLPIRENSGLALRRRGGSTELLAVGDAESCVVIVEIRRGRPGGITDLQLGDVIASSRHGRGSQFEALAVDAQGHLAVLQEDPPVVSFIDPDTCSLTGQVLLTAHSRHPSKWDERSDACAEGLLLTDHGLLVAREKRPAGLLEFVMTPPAGPTAPVRRDSRSVLAAATWWSVDRDLDDVSDLCLGPDGRIYVLSDQSRCIVRLRPLHPEGGRAEIDRAWRLDVENAEGLVLLDDMTPLVAVDRKGRKENLLVLAPLDQD